MGHHWFHISGTGGVLEWKRTGSGKPLLWLADGQMHDLAGDGLGPRPHRRAGRGPRQRPRRRRLLRPRLVPRRCARQTPLEFDVYQAMDTAAPAILAADSIDEGTTLLQVPNFRRGPERMKGEAPQV